MDQCKHCQVRGDKLACESVECSIRETWYAEALRAENTRLREELGIIAGHPDKKGFTHLSTLHDVSAIQKYADKVLETVGQSGFHARGIRAERILEKFDAWWRLPNSQRTTHNIEEAMRLAIDFLDEVRTLR